MSNQPTDLDLLHDAIVREIKTAFPAFLTVEAYREERDRQTLTAPACLIEMTELDAAPDTDTGNGQLSMVATFEARIIMGFREHKAKVAVRKAAGALAAFVHQQRWGMAGLCGKAMVLGAWPDDFSPELDQYEVWRVEWQHQIYLGAAVSWDEGLTPCQVLVSWVPRVGIPHEPDYLEITGNPPCAVHAPAPDPEPAP